MLIIQSLQLDLGATLACDARGAAYVPKDAGHMPYSLKDRRVLVTGGSRGLGALIAQKFAAEGAHIAINYASNQHAADELADKIKKEFGVKTFVVKAVRSHRHEPRAKLTGPCRMPVSPPNASVASKTPSMHSAALMDGPSSASSVTCTAIPRKTVCQSQEPSTSWLLTHYARRGQMLRRKRQGSTGVASRGCANFQQQRRRRRLHRHLVSGWHCRQWQLLALLRHQGCRPASHQVPRHHAGSKDPRQRRAAWPAVD
ncbi:hypothetical protein FH972_026385 [Carpinus fangiana]|uniref:Uncharacterized protein n=1 Tax=Carpinus fangiana TaxID=176857 RepID=A0A5N6L464_9ROSI|nr:hypothetical protein FH972_026385 [Carpinus fangiana]